jgi:hypothetical protein
VAAGEIEIPGLVLAVIKRMSECEDGIDSMQRSSTLPRDALALLRSLASALLARIAGSQRASYPLRKLVASYEESARNPAGLRKLARKEFPRLISPDGKLRFGFLETLENLPLSASRAFTLVSSKDLDANPGAIVDSPARPATQLPFIYLQGVRNVPLTFDLFLALRERENKRDASSESASIRAAVGQLRVLLAGAVGRSKQGFEEYKHWYEVGATHEIHLDAAGNPGLTDKEER